MRTRAAITVLLATGLLMSGGGVALGIGDLGNAGIAQYGKPTTPVTLVVPEQERAVAQVSPTSSGQLPFTGLAAIPLVLIGLGLVVVGLVLKRDRQAKAD